MAEQPNGTQKLLFALLTIATGVLMTIFTYLLYSIDANIVKLEDRQRVNTERLVLLDRLYRDVDRLEKEVDELRDRLKR